MSAVDNIKVAIKNARLVLLNEIKKPPVKAPKAAPKSLQEVFAATSFNRFPMPVKLAPGANAELILFAANAEMIPAFVKPKAINSNAIMLITIAERKTFSISHLSATKPASGEIITTQILLNAKYDADNAVISKIGSHCLLFTRIKN